MDEAPPRGKRTGAAGPTAAPRADAKAEEIAKRVLIVDGHIDLPYRLMGSRAPDGTLTEDVSQRTPTGDFDYPRAKAGGLDAPFMSIYVPAEYQTKGGAKKLADELIDLVESIIAAHPDKFARAYSVAEVRANFAAGKISLPLGIENGAAIEGDLRNLKHFYDRGVRYITLTHSEDNDLCDSSYSDKHTHKGLSALGKKVVREMNRLGIMIDVSHISDDAFWQVIELSEAPVIASHSSARHFTPGFERNLSDDMIKAIGKKDGVVMINFGSSFINQESREHFQRKRDAMNAYMKENGIEDRRDPRVKEWSKQYDAKHPPKFATVQQVADHIEHVIKLVGIDHVGLGSDFDGVGDTLPIGLKDVSMYPNLIAELLARGYTEQDIAKIAGENVLRVWQAVEDHAAAH
ncbi:MAG: membrane dipeptidase [Deltaproteobacteria bacterium]|nr:MAG: membrane dipeptidase [Deltaproteobacteria bacterium]